MRSRGLLVSTRAAHTGRGVTILVSRAGVVWPRHSWPQGGCLDWILVLAVCKEGAFPCPPWAAEPVLGGSYPRWLCFRRRLENLLGAAVPCSAPIPAPCLRVFPEPAWGRTGGPAATQGTEETHAQQIFTDFKNGTQQILSLQL